MVPIHLKRLSDSGKAEMPLSPDICGGSALGRDTPRHAPAQFSPGRLWDPQPPAWSQDPQTPTQPVGPTHHQRHQFLLQPAGKTHVYRPAHRGSPHPHPSPGSAHLFPTAPRAAVAPVSAALRAAALDTAAGSAFCEAIAAPGARTGTLACGRHCRRGTGWTRLPLLGGAAPAPLGPSLRPAVPLGAGLGPRCGSAGVERRSGLP